MPAPDPYDPQDEVRQEIATLQPQGFYGGAEHLNVTPNPKPTPTGGGGFGGTNEGAGSPGTVFDRVNTPAAREVLDKIASGESPDYNTRFDGSPTGAHFDDLGQHPHQEETIPEGMPYAGSTSDAAGRYMFLGSTWEGQKAKLGLQNFGPQSQDVAALDLAETEYARTTGGRSLLQDVQNGTADYSKLAGQWPSLSGGGKTLQTARRGQTFSPISEAEAAEPSTPTGPKQIGPFKSAYDAWNAAPPNLNTYTLQGDDKSGFTWMPRPPGQSAFMMNQDPAFMQSQQAAFQKAAQNYTRQRYMTVGDMLSDALMQIGPAFNKDIAATIGAPGDLMQMASNAITSTVGTKPIEFPLIKTPQMQKLMGSIGINTEPKEDNWMNYGASTVTQFAGSALLAGLPMLAAGAKAMTGSATAAKAVAEFASNPLKASAMTAAEGAGMGVGAADVGEMYRTATGRKDDTGQSAAELVGTLATSPRMPLVFGAYKAAGALSGAMYNGVKHLFGGGQGAEDAKAMATKALLSNPEAAQKIDEILRARLQNAWDETDSNMASLGRVGSGPITEGELKMIQEAAIQRAYDLKSEVAHAVRDIQQTDRMLWADIAKGQDTGVMRDFSATKNMEAQLRQDFGARPMQSPSNYPSWLSDLLNPENPHSGGRFLGNEDTITNGIDLRARIQDAIDQEVAKRTPNNALLGNLQKVQSALLKDLSQPTIQVHTGTPQMPSSQPIGMEPHGDIDQRVAQAAMFSKQADTLIGAPGVQAVLQGQDSGAMERLLKKGPEAYDALNQVVGMAQKMYGGEGPQAMLGLIKDGLRQKFINEVAPYGYVSQSRYDQFMQNHRGLMSNPQLADVRAQFAKAAQNEQEVTQALGFGNTNARQLGSWQARQSAVDLYLNSPSDVAVKAATRGTITNNPFQTTQAILAQLNQDTTGQAFKGFKQLIAQKFLDETQEGTRNVAGWLRQNDATLQAIGHQDPGFIDRLVDGTSPSTPAGFGNTMSNWFTNTLAKYAGARAIEKVTGGNMGSEFLMAHQGAQAGQLIAGQLAKLTDVQRMKVTAAMIADEDYYSKFLAGAFKTPDPRQGISNFFQGMAPAILGAAVPGIYEPGHPQPQQQAPANGKPAQ